MQAGTSASCQRMAGCPPVSRCGTQHSRDRFFARDLPDLRNGDRESDRTGHAQRDPMPWLSRARIPWSLRAVRG